MPDQRARILIVDDDESVLISLERVLESAGFSTVTAWSGREAAELLRQSQFDCLLVDAYLPDLQAAGLFQSMPSPAFRFMMFPGSDGAQQSLTPGVDGAVCKWAHEEIAAKIRRCFAA